MLVSFSRKMKERTKGNCMITKQTPLIAMWKPHKTYEVNFQKSSCFHFDLIPIQCIFTSPLTLNDYYKIKFVSTVRNLSRLVMQLNGTAPA